MEYRIGALNCGRSNHIVQYNSFYCKNCIEAENLAHKELKEKRLVGEWFEITYDLANSVVKKITGEINEKYDPLINYRKGDDYSAVRIPSIRTMIPAIHCSSSAF